jgi:hypothetical membrane protein
LLFVAITQFALLTNIAETQYPNFSIRNTLLSNLGNWGTPSALIFNASLIIFGCLGLAIGFVLKGVRKLTFIPLLFGLGGLGMLIMGIFPLSVDWAHDVGAFLAFVLMALAALCCYWTFPGPFRYVSLMLGVIAFITMVLYKGCVYVGLGAAGMERMIVYPLFLWMAAFGVALFLGDEDYGGDSILHRFFNYCVLRVYGPQPS